MPPVTVVCRFGLIVESEERSVVRFRAVAFDEAGEAGQPQAVDILPGAQEVTAEGDFQLHRTDRLSRMLGMIAANRAKLSELQDVGAQLWTGLLSSEVSERFEAIRARWAGHNPFYQVRVGLPPELEELPWETLYDERQVGFFSKSSDHCVIRVPSERIALPQFGPPHSPPLRILFAIPQGSNLGVGTELRSIEAEIEQAAGAAISLKPLRGRVTPALLARTLVDQPSDIVQFSGHGGVADNRVKLRFNSDDASASAQDLDIDDFAGMFRNRSVRLALLNSCHSASGFSNRSLAGAGPYLMRSGVPAVIAMRHEIDDVDAIRFSSEFYRELVRTGRLDLAIAWARQQVSLNSTPDRVQGFATPAFYVADGIPRLFQPGRQIGPGIGGVATTADSKMALPKALVSAVGQRRCIPVLGPGLLRTSVPRAPARGAPPGPKELAERLKEQFGYPDDNDFKASDSADWTDLFLLQRVCQHSLTIEEEFTVIEAIKDAYLKEEPPPTLLDLARWPLPGVVCTFIDGLMWQALTRQANPPRVLNRVDAVTEIEENRTVLLNLRGTVADSKSLVLTERDHEDLWDQMSGPISPAISNLVLKEDGRTLLFCGVSPRDQTVRRFMHRLLPHGPPRTMGPIFWVVDRKPPVDDVYWKRYKVQWVVEPCDRFIAALSGTLGAPTP